VSHNFLDIRPGQDRSNLWRNVVGLIVGIVGLGVVVLWTTSPRWLSASFLTQKKTIEFPVAGFRGGITGGDIVVLPPIVVQPKLIGELPPESDFTAQAIFVKDEETGIVLYAKNSYTPHPIASITKLMSSLVLLEKQPDWSATTTVIGADSLDSHMYAGDVYTLEQLWNTALIGSSNKAILSLAHAIDWPNEAFVERMNQKARELGMADTSFTDPTGLDDTDISTASDIAMLLRESLKQEKMRETVLKSEYTLTNLGQKDHHLWSTNWLLLGWIPNHFEKVLGGKTGYIPASGYNFTVALRDERGHTILVVVLGADTHEARFVEARDIAEAVFSSYRWPDDVSLDDVGTTPPLL